MPSSRTTEILDTAAALVAANGTRISLREVAAACGVLPGSLYHHFDSKEALLVALVRRYHDDLDRVAQAALDALADRPEQPVDQAVVDLGRAIAACAVRHRASVLLTIHEPAPGSSPDFARLVSRTPTGITHAMHGLLSNGAGRGEIRGEVDLRMLSERTCQSMLHHAVGDSYLQRGADRIPGLRCRMLLDGLATTPPPDDDLDGSAALAAARDAIATWTESEDGDERVARLRSAARGEFGRRGYEAATVRQVADAAGLTPDAVYRCFGSKEALLASVMRPYATQRQRVWEAVLDSRSSSLERLDALAWLNITLLERFRDEFRIQLGWLRQSPPNIGKLGSSAAQRRAMRRILDSGLCSGEVGFRDGTAEARARCVYEAIWVPERIVDAAGVAGAHRLVRETLLRGALVRR